MFTTLKGFFRLKSHRILKYKIHVFASQFINFTFAQQT